MRAQMTIKQWRRAVYRSPALSDAVRVYLLLLSEHMKPNREVSVPRKQLADMLGRHVQRVAERNSAAVELGFLTVVRPGYRGSTAVYQGCVPDPEEASRRREDRECRKGRKRTDLEYPLDPPDRYALAPQMPDMPGECVPDGEYTTSNERPTGTSAPTESVRVNHLRNGSKEEERWSA